MKLKRRRDCRLCGSASLELALPMAPSPIADAYVTAEQLGETQDLYPLDVYLCLACGHAQNLDVVDPALLFRDYLYVTSSSPSLLEHYRRYADSIVERLAPPPGGLVVDLGSNDGSFLALLRERGLRVLGVDPAREIAAEAASRGIPTIPEFFTEGLARKVREEHGPAELVTANNVFAHTDDLGEIARGVRELLSDTGVFVFEVSYLVDIVDRFLFDTIYHEHVSYHSVAPLERFFDRHGLQLFDVQRNDSKGGSLRGFVQRRPGHCPLGPAVRALVEMERVRGFSGPERFREFARDIDVRRQRLLELLDAEGGAGRLLAGYGASTTVTTLLFQFDLSRRLSFLVDDNPRKQGRFSPGGHLPVRPAAELYSRRPALCVILAWNYFRPIASRNRRYLDEGGRFVVPLPELEVLDRSFPG